MNTRDKRKKVIIELMNDKSYVPMKEKELAIILQVHSSDREELSIILKELRDEGRIEMNNRGRYSLNSKGLADKEAPVVGTFERSNRSYGFVIPDNKKSSRDVFVKIEDSLNAKDGQKVVCEVTVKGLYNRSPEGKIVEVLGDPGDPLVDTMSILRAFNIPTDFPEKVINQAERIKDHIIEADTYGREDLRDICTITIDGEDTKDIDDAISLQMDGENYILGVHIADVSNYVQENSALDHEAINRGTSVYLPDMVVPMLPRKLSNGICSLNPNEDRLTLSCIMTVAPDGKVIDSRIVESVINSNYKMTYTSVNKIIALKDDNERKQYEDIVSMLDNMYELSKIVRARRGKRGAIDFDLPECSFKLDANGYPEEILLHERNEATKLIEDFMLLANETVAETYYWMGAPFVYRVHEEPDIEKVHDLSRLVNNYGYHIHISNEQIHAKEFQKLLKKTEGSAEADMIARSTLRSMKQAVYSTECKGHFGLASKYYCHFTSPIRRYPDLQIHRIIKDNIRGRLDAKKRSHFDKILDSVATNSSRTERRAVEAEREADKSKMCLYMERHLGDIYDAIISGVTEWGIYVELPNTVEGLVHISRLPGDFYVYDEKERSMKGREHGRTYRLGDRVKVQCIRVDVSVRAIDFDIYEEE